MKDFALNSVRSIPSSIVFTSPFFFILFIFLFRFEKERDGGKGQRIDAAIDAYRTISSTEIRVSMNLTILLYSLMRNMVRGKKLIDEFWRKRHVRKNGTTMIRVLARVILRANFELAWRLPANVSRSMLEQLMPDIRRLETTIAFLSSFFFL